MHQFYRYLAMVLVANAPYPITAAAQSPPPPSATRAPSDAPAAKAFKGLEVALKIERTDAVIYNELDLLITYSCSAKADHTHRILNLSLSPLMELPGDLVIRDDKGREVNRITDRTAGSIIAATERDRVSLSPGDSKVTKLRIQAARNRDTREWIGNGEYTLQFEMHPAAIGLQGDRGTPIVRSEAIKFRLGP